MNSVELKESNSDSEEETKRNLKEKLFTSTMKNDLGRLAARNPKNEKYYWGCSIKLKFKTNKIPKKWEYAGNGTLNCPSWMKLDVEARNLFMHCLVNLEGRISKMDDKYSFSCSKKLSNSNCGEGNKYCQNWKVLNGLYDEWDYDILKFPYFESIYQQEEQKILRQISQEN